MPGIIVDPELDQVIQREIGKINQLHLGPRFTAYFAHGLQGVEDGASHPVGAVLVAGPDLDLQGHRLLLGTVDQDFGLRCRLVGDDDQLPVDGPDLERAPAELFDPPFPGVDAHPVVQLERVLEIEDDPRKQVAEDVLQGETDDHGKHRRRSQQHGDLDIQVIIKDKQDADDVEDEHHHVLDQLGITDALFLQQQEVKDEIGQGLDGENQQEEPDQQPEDEKQARGIKKFPEQMAAEHGNGRGQEEKQQQLQGRFPEKAAAPLFSGQQKKYQQQ